MGIWKTIKSPFRQLPHLPRNRTGQFTFRDQFAVIVVDGDVPDVFGSAQMDRAAGGGDVAGLGRAQVVAIDDRPDGVILIRIDHHQRCNAAHRFGQNTRRPAMEDAMDLVGAAVNRHAGGDEIITDFDEFNSDMIDDGIVGDKGFNFIRGIFTVPDHILYASPRDAGLKDSVPSL